MKDVTHELVTRIVDMLNDDLREAYEERAGIVQFSAHLSKEQAECFALLDVIYRHAAAFTKLTAIHIKLNGSSQWWLTTDLNSARNHLKYLGGVEMEAIDLADVVGRQFSGIAMLEAVR